MNATLCMELPPTYTNVEVSDYSDDPYDPLAGVALAADTEMVAVLCDDFDNDQLAYEDELVSGLMLDDEPTTEPPDEWDDYTTDDYRLFVGL